MSEVNKSEQFLLALFLLEEFYDSVTSFGKYNFILTRHSWMTTNSIQCESFSQKRNERNKTKNKKK